MQLTLLSAIGIVLPAMTLAIALFSAVMVRTSEVATWRTLGLVIFLLIAASDSVDDLLLATGVYHALPALFGWGAIGPMLYGSSLCLYVYSMTASRPVVLTGRQWLLFVAPALFGFALALPIYWQPVGIKLALLNGDADFMANAPHEVSMSVAAITLAFFSVNAFFLYLMFRRLATHVDSIQDLFSNIEHRSLNWLRWVLLVSFAVLVSVGARLWVSEDGKAASCLDIFRLLVQLSWIASFAYFGARQCPVTPDTIGAAADGHVVISGPIEQGGESRSTTAYARSGLTRERMQKIAAKLQQAMQEQQLYRESQLSLRSLSEQIGVPENYVSETLNVFLGQKFFHFVNAHRIQASKQQLINSGDTILTIANDVGFNSRSTFNEAFKKHAGTTPSAFRTTGAEVDLCLDKVTTVR